MSWFLSHRASSHLLCAFMPFHFSPSSPHFSSALILSSSPFFPSTPHWNIPRWSIRLHKSTAVRSSKRERLRDYREVRGALPCRLPSFTILLLSFSPHTHSPHCNEGQTKVISSTVKRGFGSLKRKARLIPLQSRRASEISRGLMELLLNTNYWLPIQVVGRHLTMDMTAGMTMFLFMQLKSDILCL